MTKSVFTGEFHHSSKVCQRDPCKDTDQTTGSTDPCITIGTQISAQKQTQTNFRSFLSAFAKLRQAITRIVILSVRPRRTNRISLDVFS
jgi:hypothetical protein